MMIIYKCDYCNKEFKNPNKCMEHESSHLKDINKIKYELMHFYNKDVCDYCDYSYYVYGVERECEHKDCSRNNNYKDFIPTEPLHDKMVNGGV